MSTALLLCTHTTEKTTSSLTTNLLVFLPFGSSEKKNILLKHSGVFKTMTLPSSAEILQEIQDTLVFFTLIILTVYQFMGCKICKTLHTFLENTRNSIPFHMKNRICLLLTVNWSLVSLEDFLGKHSLAWKDFIKQNHLWERMGLNRLPHPIPSPVNIHLTSMAHQIQSSF